MAVERKTALGALKVHDDVIASIAEEAVLSTDGVSGMVARGVRDEFSEWLKRDERVRGVAVTVDGDSLLLELHVAVVYGVRLSEVGRQIGERVNRAMDQALSFRPNHISIYVEEVKRSD